MYLISGSFAITVSREAFSQVKYTLWNNVKFYVFTKLFNYIHCKCCFPDAKCKISIYRFYLKVNGFKLHVFLAFVSLKLVKLKVPPSLKHVSFGHFPGFSVTLQDDVRTGCFHIYLLKKDIFSVLASTSVQHLNIRAGFFDITTSLEANHGPVRHLHKCDVGT